MTLSKKHYFYSLLLICILCTITHAETLPVTPFFQPVLSTIGDPNNSADPKTGLGAVDETFLLGTHNVTAEEYCDFLNAVATSDPYGLYNTNMGSDSLVACIQRSGEESNYHYSLIPEKGIKDFPITYVSWFNAARFCNWLHNGQPRGKEDATTTEMGAYSLNGATNGSIILAEANAAYFLPSEDQWYKAAYYKGGSTDAGYWKYPFQSDEKNNFLQERLSAPTAYGTSDMGTDIFQWTSSSDVAEAAIIRGDDWTLTSINDEHSSRFSTNAVTTTESASIGFRIAASYDNMIAPQDGLSVPSTDSMTIPDTPTNRTPSSLLFHDSSLAALEINPEILTVIWSTLTDTWEAVSTRVGSWWSRVTRNSGYTIITDEGSAGTEGSRSPLFRGKQTSYNGSGK